MRKCICKPYLGNVYENVSGETSLKNVSVNLSVHVSKSIRKRLWQNVSAKTYLKNVSETVYETRFRKPSLETFPKTTCPETSQKTPSKNVTRNRVSGTSLKLYLKPTLKMYLETYPGNDPGPKTSGEGTLENTRIARARRGISHVEQSPPQRQKRRRGNVSEKTYMGNVSGEAALEQASENVFGNS